MKIDKLRSPQRRGERRVEAEIEFFANLCDLCVSAVKPIFSQPLRGRVRWRGTPTRGSQKALTLAKLSTRLRRLTSVLATLLSARKILAAFGALFRVAGVTQGLSTGGAGRHA